MDTTSIQQYIYQLVQQVTEYLQNLLVALRHQRSRASRNLQKLWRNASYRASSRTPTTSSGAPRNGNGAASQHTTVKPTRSDKSKFERVVEIFFEHAQCRLTLYLHYFVSTSWSPYMAVITILVSFPRSINFVYCLVRYFISNNAVASQTIHVTAVIIQYFLSHK
jgi:hypothetical protein